MSKSFGKEQDEVLAEFKVKATNGGILNLIYSAEIVKLRRENKRLAKQLEIDNDDWANTYNRQHQELKDKESEFAKKLEEKESEFAKKLEEKDAEIARMVDTHGSVILKIQKRESEVKRLKHQSLPLCRAIAELSKAINDYHAETGE